MSEIDFKKHNYYVAFRQPGTGFTEGVYTTSKDESSAADEAQATVQGSKLLAEGYVLHRVVRVCSFGGRSG